MYEWVKALHVISVVVWMAGMICLPQLLAHHRNIAVGSDGSDTLKFIERRLLKSIINPAMILAWIAGPYLAWAGDWWTTPWFQVKIALVLALSGMHGVFSRWVKDFSADKRRTSPLALRFASELPIVTLVAVVVLVVVKPF